MQYLTDMIDPPRITVAILLLLAVAITACPAQVQGTYVHDTDTMTTYLRMDESRLLVVGRDAEGRCVAYPSVIDWDGNTLVHQRGTEWTIRETEHGITVNTPLTNDPLRYEKVDGIPMRRCTNYQPDSDRQI